MSAQANCEPTATSVTVPMGIVVGFYLSLVPGGAGTIVRVDGGVEGGTADGPLGPMVARNLADAMQKSLAKLAQVVTAHGGAARGGAGRAGAGRAGAERGGAGRGGAERGAAPGGRGAR